MKLDTFFLGWTDKAIQRFCDNVVKLSRHTMYNDDFGHKELFEDGSTYEFRYVVYTFSEKIYKIWINDNLVKIGYQH